MRFLIDEMFPPATARRLVELGHDGTHVRDLALDARPDTEVAAAAIRERRVLVTENVKDFVAERDLVVLCVLKARLPARDMAARLERLLDGWAGANPDHPYVGLHRPKIDG